MLKFPDIVVKSSSGMRLFKRKNGIWYAGLRRGVERSLKTRDEREARLRLRDIEREVLRGKLLLFNREPSMTLSGFLKEYEDWALKNKAQSTWERIHFTIPKLIDVLGQDKQLLLIKRRDMDAYVDYCRNRGNKPVTINIEIRHIKAMLSKAVEWEYLRESPFKGVKQIKYHKAPPGFITDPRAIDKVFEVIGKNKLYRLVFAMYVYTGARGGEINRLEWKDISESFITFRNRKNYNQLRVPVVEKLKTILSEYERGVGRIMTVSKKQMARTLRGYLKKAGLDIRPHDLRHTFASHLVMAGVDLKAIQDLLGHSSYQATLIYTHLRDEHLRISVNKLPY